jgi:anthranilate synthase component 2
VILVIDHYDSFVYNLVQLVEAFGEQTLIVRSDDRPPEDLAALRPHAVILSPGPGRPENAGCMPELVKLLDESTPLLGVCLGHQAIGAAFGATVERGPEPIHGKASIIRHDERGIFEGLPNPLLGGRYHSLVVRRNDLPRDLRITAETDDGLVMGIEHRDLPRFGIQFHPESVLTPDGPQLVENFLSLR